MLSAICFNLDQSKILLPGNGLNDLNCQWKSRKDCKQHFFFLFFHYVFCLFNILAEDKILASSKPKVFAEDDFNMAEIVQFPVERIENTCIVDNGFFHCRKNLELFGEGLKIIIKINHSSLW